MPYFLWGRCVTLWGMGPFRFRLRFGTVAKQGGLVRSHVFFFRFCSQSGLLSKLNNKSNKSTIMFGQERGIGDTMLLLMDILFTQQVNINGICHRCFLFALLVNVLKSNRVDVYYTLRFNGCHVTVRFFHPFFHRGAFIGFWRIPCSGRSPCSHPPSDPPCPKNWYAKTKFNVGASSLIY